MSALTRFVRSAIPAALALAGPAAAGALGMVSGETRLFLVSANADYTNAEERLITPVIGAVLSDEAATIEQDLGPTIARVDASQQYRADDSEGLFQFRQSISVASNPDFDGCPGGGDDCIYDVIDASVGGNPYDFDAFYYPDADGFVRISWSHSGDGSFGMTSFATLDFSNSSGSADLPFLAGQEVVLTFQTGLGRRFGDVAHSGFVRYSFLTGRVPEPATWATLLAGFALTGAAARRQRRVSPRAWPGRC